MMRRIKNAIRACVPDRVLGWYHYGIAWIAALYYRHPSHEMLIIGVTGTKGKTSVANMVWACLTAGGHTVGMLTTANFRIGRQEMPNMRHMTMPGRFFIQKTLRAMRRAGCTIAIVETTSEGIKQFRHVGIAYDIGIFTNLTPEHLASHHGSFAEYKAMKGKMFAQLGRVHKKQQIPSLIVACGDSPHAAYFAAFPADRVVRYGVSAGDVRAENVRQTTGGVAFRIGTQDFLLRMIGTFNAVNALPAIIVARHCGVPDASIGEGLRTFSGIPGRMEPIDAGQPFMILVDYAHEKESMTVAVAAARRATGVGQQVIVLLGAEGGGRDKTKRGAMGQIVGQQADIVVVSNVDPYDDDPTPIVEEIACAVEKEGKIRGKNLFVIEDRREGIRKTFACARPGDVVLITGKGAETTMIIDGKTIPWDERAIVREEARAYGCNASGIEENPADARKTA